jgi:hypothetical protein
MQNLVFSFKLKKLSAQIFAKLNVITFYLIQTELNGESGKITIFRLEKFYFYGSKKKNRKKLQ